MNLHRQLGVDSRLIENMRPILEDSSLIDERTNIGSGLILLTPKIDDIVERYGVEGKDKVTLVRLGTIRYGGSGCMCPANALLRALLSHILLSRDEIVVIDLEAGLEPLGRGTVEAVDILLSIAEPTLQSIDVCRRIARLASDLGLKRVYHILNKATEDSDIHYLEHHLGSKFMAVIPFDRSIPESEKIGVPLLDYAPDSKAAKTLVSLKDMILKLYT